MAVVSWFAFVFAALMGLTMAVRHFKGLTSGKAMGIVHGLWALAGLAFLGAELARRDAGWGWWLFAGFVVVALGGLINFSRQIKGQKWSDAVIWVHGGAAIVAIAALGFWLFARAEAPATGGDVPAGSIENEAIPVEDLVD